MPQTGILYALVARKNVILAEYSGVQGNASMVALQILDKINGNEGDRLSYLIDNHVFQILISQNLIFLVMTEKSFGRRLPFVFLEDIKTRFLEGHSAEASTAPAYAFNQDFSPILRDRAAYHSNPLNDTLTRVTGEVNSLREVMVENIEQVLERGERLELLVQRTDGLAENALIFKRGATTLKRNMWWRNARTSAIVVVLVLLALYILAATICGPKLQC